MLPSVNSLPVAPTVAEVKAKVLRTAQTVDMMSAMSRSRKERRRLAKMNGINKITGSTKPYVKAK